MVLKRSAEAQALLDTRCAGSLPADSSEQTHTTLSWSASEREHLDMIADTIDRRTHLRHRYDMCNPTDARPDAVVAE